MTCTIPGFVPGAGYYAASGVLEMGQQIFRHLGLTDRRGFDIFTTMVAGLIDQRLANDPGGTRWLALQNRRSISGPTASAFPQTRRRETGGQLNHKARVAGPPHEEHLMIITRTAWPGSSIVQPAIERPTAMRLAQTEYQRVADAVDALHPEDWTRPTDCTAWDVRQLIAHIAGQANLFSTPLEVARQMRAAKARQQPGQAEVDALTAFQVEERQQLGPEALRAELRRVGPRGAKGRRRVPGFLRRRRLPGAEIVNGVPETWSLGYLTDVILTRDPWMHRLDLARATNRDLVLAADHDGVLVADVVAEWARRHGRPYRLELTGPAGGRWSSGAGGEEIVMDAADFCRILSGRRGPDGGQSSGLLATQVPF